MERGRVRWDALTIDTPREVERPELGFWDVGQMGWATKGCSTSLGTGRTPQQEDGCDVVAMLCFLMEVADSA